MQSRKTSTIMAVLTEDEVDLMDSVFKYLIQQTTIDIEIAQIANAYGETIEATQKAFNEACRYGIELKITKARLLKNGNYELNYLDRTKALKFVTETGFRQYILNNYHYEPTFPTTLNIYFLSFEGRGTPSQIEHVNTPQEYNAVLNRFLNRPSEKIEITDGIYQVFKLYEIPEQKKKEKPKFWTADFWKEEFTKNFIKSLCNAILIALGLLLTYLGFDFSMDTKPEEEKKEKQYVIPIEQKPKQQMRDTVPQYIENKTQRSPSLNAKKPDSGAKK